MAFVNIIIGISLVFFSSIYFIKAFKKKQKRKEEHIDYMGLSYDIEIYTGIAIFFVLGIVLIYKELKNLL